MLGRAPTHLLAPLLDDRVPAAGETELVGQVGGALGRVFAACAQAERTAGLFNAEEVAWVEYEWPGRSRSDVYSFVRVGLCGTTYWCVHPYVP